ncbi:MAG TPA: hypothetical protein VMG34_14400 [Bacteroidota bacterium]|nr:hypothetical protein [Bacteroidota bacterium]
MRFSGRRLRKVLAAGVFFFLASRPAAFGQDALVTTSVDSAHITVGDWLRLVIQVKHPPSVDIVWGQVRDTVGAFEVVKLDTLPPDNDGGLVTEGRKFTLSAYDSGTFSIPPMLIGYKEKGDTALKFVQSDSRSVVVATVPVDTSKAIKDIKPPLGIPLTWKEIAGYGAILIVIAGLAYLAYWYYRRRKLKAGEIPEEAPPAVMPHVRAMTRLRELLERRVWQEGNVKGFYSEATEIVREYFEGRYGIMALEMTSYEVFDQLRKFRLEQETAAQIEKLFIDADLVKFAKYIPLPSENEEVIPRALDIVERTRPKEAVAENV